jgi:hypothetical protein
MPNYTYRCPDCFAERMLYYPFHESDMPVFCQYEGAQMDKVLGVNYIHSGIEPHYNSAVGAYVQNMTDLSDKMKIASDDATERLGIPHDFRPVDPRDTEKLGVTEEGLDATMAAQVRDGKRDVKKWL